MRKPSTIPLLVFAVIVLSYFMVYMKLQGFWLGFFLLDYLFIPLSLFLLIDATISMNKDSKYFLTRIMRLVIGSVILTIHIYIIFFR